MVFQLVRVKRADTRQQKITHFVAMLASHQSPHPSRPNGALVARAGLLPVEGAQHLAIGQRASRRRRRPWRGVWLAARVGHWGVGTRLGRWPTPKNSDVGSRGKDATSPSSGTQASRCASGLSRRVLRPRRSWRTTRPLAHAELQIGCAATTPWSATPWPAPPPRWPSRTTPTTPCLAQERGGLPAAAEHPAALDPPCHRPASGRRSRSVPIHLRSSGSHKDGSYGNPVAPGRSVRRATPRCLVGGSSTGT